MVEIAILADHLDAIPTLTQWFWAQWPDHYTQRTLLDMENDFHAEANREGLPLRLVAFVEGDLAGTIVLRERALATIPEYHPGLGGLYVVARHRGHGVGTALVRAGMDTARAQGHEAVFATMTVAGGILEHLGWTLVKTVPHRDESLALYRCDLEFRGSTYAA